jgi:hypothetical protein
MNNRPFSSSDPQTELLRFLEKRCRMKILKQGAEIGFTFDTMLIGEEDPLNIFVIETKDNSSQNTLRQVGRKVQSFAWSLHAQQKRNLVTLILILPDVSSPEKILHYLGDLNGTARVFLIPSLASTAEIETALNSLAAPIFAMSHKEAVGFAQVEEILQGVDAASILQMAQSSSTDAELSSKLVSRLEELAARVQNALKKS